MIENHICIYLEAASKSRNTSGGVQLEQPWWRFPSNLHRGICRRHRTNERRRRQKEFALPRPRLRRQPVHRGVTQDGNERHRHRRQRLRRQRDDNDDDNKTKATTQTTMPTRTTTTKSTRTMIDSNSLRLSAVLFSTRCFFSLSVPRPWQMKAWTNTQERKSSHSAQ